MCEKQPVTLSFEMLVSERQRLHEENAVLRQRVQELEARLARDSHNSSKPPSSEGFRKPKSLRKPGERPRGGQPGHRGSTLKRVAQPDRLTRSRRMRD